MINNIQELIELLRVNKDHFIGTDILGINGDSNRFQDEAKEILSEHKIDPSIIDDHWVFLIHQGYVFSMVKKDRMNGPVYTYCERNEIVWDCKTMDDFIQQYADCG